MRNTGSERVRETQYSMNKALRDGVWIVAVYIFPIAQDTSVMGSSTSESNMKDISLFAGFAQTEPAFSKQ